jgi:hypothetical protein
MRKISWGILFFLFLVSSIYAQNNSVKPKFKFTDSDFNSALPDVSILRDNQSGRIPEDIDNIELNNIKSNFINSQKGNIATDEKGNIAPDELSEFIESIDSLSKKDSESKLEDISKKPNNVYYSDDSVIIEFESFKFVCEKLIEDELFLCKQYFTKTKPITHME